MKDLSLLNVSCKNVVLISDSFNPMTQSIVLMAMRMHLLWIIDLQIVANESQLKRRQICREFVLPEFLTLLRYNILFCHDMNNKAWFQLIWTFTLVRCILFYSMLVISYDCLLLHFISAFIGHLFRKIIEDHYLLPYIQNNMTISMVCLQKGDTTRWYVTACTVST